jgi:hypothetical protein
LDRWIEWPTPVRFGPIEVTELDNGGPSILATADGPIRPQHYGFVISKADSDAVFGRRSRVMRQLSSLVL